jgi:DNA (cytosine-5)-methyltransferase 1
MIKGKRNISIEEFDEKSYQTENFVNIEEKAVLTHYLHNYRNGVKKHYEKDAILTLKKFVEYKQIDQLNYLSLLKMLCNNFYLKLKTFHFQLQKIISFKFIDLFAGIGGFRLALQNVGGKCVFTSEWNNEAQKTYRANFGEVPFGDITKERNKNYIPEKFDILCAGFPCQAFLYCWISERFC